MRSSTLFTILAMLGVTAASPGLGMRQEQSDQGRGGRNPGQGQGGQNPGQGQGSRRPGGGQGRAPPSDGQVPGGFPGFGGQIPPSTCSLWGNVAADLVQNVILDSDGTLSTQGRTAIRLVFHDCFTKACDGSIILADECNQRRENAQLTDICGTLGNMALEYGVGTADIIQLAGALGVRASGGPALAFKTGRRDSSTASPTGQLPGRNDKASKQVSAFKAKGFSAEELVVLVGAHTVGRTAFGGAPMDSTPDRFDNVFYNDTAGGLSAASLNSDVFLARGSATAQPWRKYAANSEAWQTAFTAAMAKLSVMGTNASSLTDCSGVVTSAFSSS